MMEVIVLGNLTFPKWELFVILTVAMLFDFLTGFLKAKFLKINRSSEAFRKTIKKTIQYFMAIIVCLIMINMVRYDSSIKWIMDYSDYFQNIIIVFMIYIELVSILENTIAIDKTSNFAKLFIIPLHRLLTAQLKNNPFYHYSDVQQKKIEENKLKRNKEIL